MKKLSTISKDGPDDRRAGHMGNRPDRGVSHAVESLLECGLMIVMTLTVVSVYVFVRSVWIERASS